MARQLQTEHGVVHLHTNYHRRPVVALVDIPEAAQADFDYLTGDEREDWRIFEYLGAWYDLNDGFTDGRDVDWVRAAGFNALQTDSYFSGIVVRWFDEDGTYMPHDGEIVVGRVHW